MRLAERELLLGVWDGIHRLDHGNEPHRESCGRNIRGDAPASGRDQCDLARDRDRRSV